MIDTETFWNEFLINFPYGSLVLKTDLISSFKRHNINPSKYANNFFFVSNTKISDAQKIEEPTESMIKLVKDIIPPGYFLFYVAAYPDVVLWFMENYERDITDNIYFKEFSENNKKYVDEDNKLNRSGWRLITNAYKKSISFSGFECSFK